MRESVTGKPVGKEEFLGGLRPQVLVLLKSPAKSKASFGIRTCLMYQWLCRASEMSVHGYVGLTIWMQKS